MYIADAVIRRRSWGLCTPSPINNLGVHPLFQSLWYVRSLVKIVLKCTLSGGVAAESSYIFKLLIRQCTKSFSICSQYCYELLSLCCCKGAKAKKTYIGQLIIKSILSSNSVKILKYSSWENTPQYNVKQKWIILMQM